eukprot:758092-Hanusia_phi.AAC.3
MLEEDAAFLTVLEPAGLKVRPCVLHHHARRQRLHQAVVGPRQDAPAALHHRPTLHPQGVAAGAEKGALVQGDLPLLNMDQLLKFLGVGLGLEHEDEVCERAGVARLDYKLAMDPDSIFPDDVKLFVYEDGLSKLVVAWLNDDASVSLSAVEERQRWLGGERRGIPVELKHGLFKCHLRRHQQTFHLSPCAWKACICSLISPELHLFGPINFDQRFSLSCEVDGREKPSARALLLLASVVSLLVCVGQENFTDLEGVVFRVVDVPRRAMCEVKERLCTSLDVLVRAIRLVEIQLEVEVNDPFDQDCRNIL